MTMSEVKHTPGPWKWNGVPGKSDLFGLAGVQVIANYGYEGMCFSTFNDEQDEANARLMEAAPELLDALTALMQWVENWEPNFTQDDEWPADRKRFRAAIAKAQGTDQ